MFGISHVYIQKMSRWVRCSYVICMLHVCYMFEQHVTWLNPFVQGHLRHIML